MDLICVMFRTVAEHARFYGCQVRYAGRYRHRQSSQ